MGNNKKSLLRAIAEIEKIYPDDGMIQSYADFLKVRHCLKFYQFNPSVFHHLLSLAIDNWTSAKRINRLSILQTLKYYLYNTLPYASRDYYERFQYLPHPITSFETRQSIFQLFKLVFEEPKYISFRQIEAAESICNNLMYDIELTEIDAVWLCNNISKSQHILNRLLRYPALSKAITSWAKKHYFNKEYSSRRAELLSWILDEDPDFEVDTETLIDDFNYLNKKDKFAIEQYSQEIDAQKIVEQEFGDMLTPPKEEHELFPGLAAFSQEHSPQLNLSGRFYAVPTNPSTNYFLKIPDFERMTTAFYNNLEKLHKITMIWGIGYSRMDIEKKLRLLEKYYCADTYYSIFRLGRRTNNVAILRWLLSKEA